MCSCDGAPLRGELHQQECGHPAEGSDHSLGLFLEYCCMSKYERGGDKLGEPRGLPRWLGQEQVAHEKLRMEVTQPGEQKGKADLSPPCPNGYYGEEREALLWGVQRCSQPD